MLSGLSLADSTIIGVALSKAFIVLFVLNLSPVLQYQFFEYVKVNNHVVLFQFQMKYLETLVIIRLSMLDELGCKITHACTSCTSSIHCHEQLE